MEDIAFFIFCLLSIINIDVKGVNNFFEDYIELENTYSVKGIFVWLVVFNHHREYYSKNKYLYEKIMSFVGQKVVSLFFFYFGFEIYQSIKNKGNKYVKTLPVKTLILFIKSQLILLIFLVFNLFLRNKITLKQFFLSIIFKENIGNSDWFVFNILSYYLLSFLCFIFIKNKNYNFIGIFLITIIICLFSYFEYNYYYNKKIFTVENSIPFILGFYYSLLYKETDKIIMKNDINYFLILFFFMFLYFSFYSYRYEDMLTYLNINGLFSLIVIIVTMKVRFDNEFLRLLNSHSFSIYLLQRTIMMTVYKKNYFNNHEFIGFFIQFVFILLISSGFDKYTSFIDKYFKRNNSDNEKESINNEVKLVEQK